MSADAFYVVDGHDPDGATRFVSTGHTNGPWGRGLQHAGPPSALLGRAMEQLPATGERILARVTVDLWGPVPVAPVTVSARVDRPGRSVELLSAELVAADRVVARASAWRFVAQQTDVRTPAACQPPGPDHGGEQARPQSWHGGYLDAVEWRWIEGAVVTPGPATVWMRPRVALVTGEPLSPLQRLLVCADSANGVSAVLDPAAWRFMNTELSVHVTRQAEGDWICVDAETTFSGTSAGLAAARLLDRNGLVGRSAQSLVVTPK